MCPCFVKKSENCKNAFIYDIICSKIIYYTQIIGNCEIKDENTDNLKMSFAKYFIADLQPLSQLRCQLYQASPVQGEGDHVSGGRVVNDCIYCVNEVSANLQPLSHLTVPAPLTQGSLWGTCKT